MKNMDEIMKKFEELKGIIDEKTKKHYKDSKEEMKKNINKLIDESEELIWCVTDKGVVAGGTSYDMLTAIAIGLAKMSKDKNIPKKMVIQMIEAGFETEEEDEEEKEGEDIFDKIKEMIEEW